MYKCNSSRLDTAYWVKKSFAKTKVQAKVAKVLWTCVLQDLRGNSGVTVSYVAPMETAEIITVETILYCGQMSHRTWDCLAWCGGGLGLRVGLAGCRFLLCRLSILLCSLAHCAWLGRPQHAAHEGIKYPGILFMTWQAQRVMNGWLLVFLFKMCCHKACWACTTCGISVFRRKLVVILTLLKQGKLFFSFFNPSTLSSGS